MAGDGAGEGPVGVTYPSEMPSPCHGDNTTEAVRPRITPGGADWEVSLTELEKGRAEPAKAAIVADVITDDDLVVGHDESGVAAAGGVDVEGGRSGVDGNANEVVWRFKRDALMDVTLARVGRTVHLQTTPPVHQLL